MNKIPTEREVLLCIYQMYESSYPDAKPRENDPFISIKIEDVAKKLKSKPELIFGYLYYHLDAKHKYQIAENLSTHLFVLNVGGKHHAVNFPYLAAILANHNQEYNRQLWSIGLAVVAILISVISIIVQFYPVIKTQ